MDDPKPKPKRKRIDWHAVLFLWLGIQIPVLILFVHNFDDPKFRDIARAMELRNLARYVSQWFSGPPKGQVRYVPPPSINAYK